MLIIRITIVVRGGLVPFIVVGGRLVPFIVVAFIATVCALELAEVLSLFPIAPVPAFASSGKRSRRSRSRLAIEEHLPRAVLLQLLSAIHPHVAFVIGRGQGRESSLSLKLLLLLQLPELSLVFALRFGSSVLRLVQVLLL